jgi:hypothetical protein
VNSTDLKEACKQAIAEAKAILEYTDSIDATESENLKRIFGEARHDGLSHLQKHVVALTEMLSGEEPKAAENMDGFEASKGDKRIIIDCHDENNSLQELLEYIRDNGESGHSFPILVDGGDTEREKTFGWDGDGSDGIRSIEVEDLYDGEVKKNELL